MRTAERSGPSGVGPCALQQGNGIHAGRDTAAVSIFSISLKGEEPFMKKPQLPGTSRTPEVLAELL